MELIACVSSKMTSDGLCNVVAVNKDKYQYNLKISLDLEDQILINHIYLFEVSKKEGIRVSYHIESFKDINSLDGYRQDEILRDFLPSSPYRYEDGMAMIYEYVNKIDNKIIKDLVNALIEKYIDKFFIYPAAAKMHHAYVGGLVHHSLSMLKMADSFIANYNYLKKDYLYAGVILHDIGKAIELDGLVNTSYTVEGQLIGHLVIGAIEIGKMAEKLGYGDAKEVLVLEHMLISHHGVPQFGSAKKPMTAEALALWYIDTIDSKFRVLEVELAKTNVGEFTDAVSVVDKMKFYKA